MTGGRVTAREATAEAEAAGVAASTLRVAGAGTLLVLVAFTTVLTTAHDTAVALHASLAWQTWALSAMSLGLAAALLTVGALADDLGRRRALLASAVALALATAAAAGAPSIAAFVAARVLQGMAGAGVLAASLGLIGHAFPTGPPRARATGVWGAAVGGGIALGPLLAGALDAAGDWRTAYWCQAGLALLLGLAAAALPESRAPARRAVDVPGAVVLSAGMATVTAALVSGRQSWGSPVTLALLVAGVALLGLFVAVELRRAEPMLDLRLLRRPAFVASLAGALVTGLSTIALMSYLPTFLQRALHLSVLGSAGVVGAWSATSALVAWHARRLPAGLEDRHRLAIGFALCAGGLAALSGLPAEASWARLVPGLVVAGLGTGLVNAALGRLAVASVPADRPGMGSGANNTARYLGGAAGVALVIALAAQGSGPARPAALVHGWNTAALVTAGLSAAGAAAVAMCRERASASA
jgi:MFS family permease